MTTGRIVAKSWNLELNPRVFWERLCIGLLLLRVSG